MVKHQRLNICIIMLNGWLLEKMGINVVEKTKMRDRAGNHKFIILPLLSLTLPLSSSSFSSLFSSARAVLCVLVGCLCVLARVRALLRARYCIAGILMAAHLSHPWLGPRLPPEASCVMCLCARLHVVCLPACTCPLGVCTVPYFPDSMASSDLCTIIFSSIFSS